MLHSLAYLKFTNIMENVCYRNCIWLRKVNPAWTSWIAKQKYCPKMKLNIHTGISFVITRRGQSYTDKVQNDLKNLSYKDVLDARQSSISLYGIVKY